MSRLAKLKKCAARCSGFKPSDVATANATSRSGGAVGDKALVPRLIRRLASKADSILDFGAGAQAAHTAQLTKAGFDCTAYDFGKNQSEDHDTDALKRSYDVVFASNVLNVQSSEEMANKTLTQIAGATKSGGFAIANFPDSPRKCPNLTTEKLIALARRKFRNVSQIGGSSSAPVLKMEK